LIFNQKGKVRTTHEKPKCAIHNMALSNAHIPMQDDLVRSHNKHALGIATVLRYTWF